MQTPHVATRSSGIVGWMQLPSQKRWSGLVWKPSPCQTKSDVRSGNWSSSALKRRTSSGSQNHPCWTVHCGASSKKRNTSDESLALHSWNCGHDVCCLYHHRKDMPVSGQCHNETTYLWWRKCHSKLSATALLTPLPAKCHLAVWAILKRTPCPETLLVVQLWLQFYKPMHVAAFWLWFWFRCEGYGKWNLHDP